MTPWVLNKGGLSVDAPDHDARVRADASGTSHDKQRLMQRIANVPRLEGVARALSRVTFGLTEADLCIVEESLGIVTDRHRSARVRSEDITARIDALLGGGK